METLAHTVKVLVKNRNYQNERHLEILKNDVINFIKEFNAKHEAKKAEGWE